MNSAPSNTPRRPLPVHSADLRGLARLGVDAMVGVTDVVEAMHHTIVSRAGIVGPAAAGRTDGISGFIYRSVRGTTRVVGKGLDAVLGRLAAAAPAERQPQREAWLAALNGVWGDHLVETGNPLAIAMKLSCQGHALAFTSGTLDEQIKSPSGRVVVLAHGLVMNDLQWSRQGHDHGQMLERDLGFTPVYLHYNSGRHVSQNGREFAALLAQLVAAWPVPVIELVIVGHSMGGLVARSACFQAQGQARGQTWLAKLTKLVCLGTPHHGAPLERGGRLVDAAFGISPYGAPFARLGKARSAGITDLRYGNLQDADWKAGGRHAQHHDDRHPTPLPQGVRVYLAAATQSASPGGLRDKMIGDGLVPLASALGEHRNPALALHVPACDRLVVTQANHWDLLNRPEVAAKLGEWLA